MITNPVKFIRLGHKFFCGQVGLADKVRPNRSQFGKLADKRLDLDPRYQPDSLLDTTKSSCVYLATDLESDRPVAIKQAHPMSTEHLIRWEGDILGRLRHPKIVSMIADQGKYLVEEFMPGETLNNFILSPLETLVVAFQLVDALRYAHAQNIVVRDLKPENVMVMPDGVVKLFDFNLARDLNQPEDICPRGDFYGTSRYAAPELIRHGIGVALPPADYFSLGITLYRALTGYFPQARQVRTASGYHFVSFPKTGHPLNGGNLKDIPMLLHNLLYKLLEPDESQRLADPDRVEQELVNCLAEVGCTR